MFSEKFLRLRKIACITSEGRLGVRLVGSCVLSFVSGPLSHQNPGLPKLHEAVASAHLWTQVSGFSMMKYAPLRI